MSIDFIVTWVDGNDPKWLLERSKYDKTIDLSDDANNQARYRDMDLFHYWFRAVEKYAPWVNKIFLVTADQVPEWLNTEHPKLVMVNHRDYIPQNYLPTYNSNVIELNFHRIKDLGERFVIFNDDFFLNAPVLEENFFEGNLPKDFGIYKPILPDSPFAHILVNNIMVMNKYYRAKKTFRANLFKFFNLKYSHYIVHNVFALFNSGITGYHNAHVALPALKSTFEKVWELEHDLLSKTSSNRFRTLEDVNHWLMSHWNIENNQFVPQYFKFGKTYPMSAIADIKNDVEKQQSKVICINDSADTQDFDDLVIQLKTIFEAKFPEKSSFEK